MASARPYESYKLEDTTMSFITSAA
ncbi:uncharacterized protein G2W53_036209 [Senna tora]|uniref:Uncharacterized protein n=1 Tax=Senna tora TaxID=362788 RepID=A0A834W8I3_9FABA|nr:uncharacterized protein G2W53_036209 [Senna tora]